MAKFNAYRAARAQIRAQQRAAQVAQAKNRLQYGASTIHQTRAPTNARAQAHAALKREQEQQRAKVNFNRLKYGQDENPKDVADRYKDQFGSAMQGVDNVTGALGGIPGVRAGGAVVRAGLNIASGAAQGGAMGGPVGAAAGAAAAALQEFTRSIGAAVNKIGDFASVAVRYNPQAAQAGAMAQVRGIQGDISRSNYLGSELAGFMTAKSNLSERFEDSAAQLLKPLIPMATQLMENLLRFINWAEPFAVDTINKIIQALNDVLVFADKSLNALSDTGIHFQTIQKIEHHARTLAKKADPTPFSEFLELPQIRELARPADDFRPAGGGGPGIPGVDDRVGAAFRAFGFNIG